MLNTITDFLSKSFTDDNVPSDILRISDIPSEAYRKTLLQELISSQFFESSSGAQSIFNFLSSLTKFYTESQADHDPFITFYSETLDMLLRRSLSNFSEDKTQNVFICNNYSLQLENSLPTVKLLWMHITSDSGSQAIFHDLLAQLNKENGKSIPLSLLQTIVSFSCLSLSYSLSRLSDQVSKEEDNYSNRFLEILRAISCSLDRLKIINEQHVFDEWLANFLVEIYKVLEVAKKAKQDKTIEYNIFKQLCKSLFSNEKMIDHYKIINFLCGRSSQDKEKVKILLDRKYKAYIITYSLTIEIEYYIITDQEIMDKKIPSFLQNINQLCIVFQRTPKPEQKPYKTSKTRGKQFEDVLGKIIRTIISRSNDENGFVVMRAIVDYIDLITHINKSKTTQPKGQHIFTRKKNSENEILGVLRRGIFGYKMLLSALEWSIDAIIDFLLENYAFLELLFKVLKQFTSCHKTDVLGWLTDIELNRIEFFTDELMKRLMEYKNQFSFNVTPLINLLKQAIELCKNET